MRGDDQEVESDIDNLVSAASAAKIRSKRQRQQPEDYQVLPENWNAVLLFLDCADSWEITSQGRYIGLRTEAADIEIRRGGYEPLPPDDWKRLKVLSRTAAKELNRLADRRR